MSETIDAAVAALNDKMSGGFDGTAKFVIEGEGAIMLDSDGDSRPLLPGWLAGGVNIAFPLEVA